MLMPMRLIVADQKNFYKHVAIVCCCVLAMYIAFDEFTNLAYGEMEGYKLITD